MHSVQPGLHDGAEFNTTVDAEGSPRVAESDVSGGSYEGGISQVKSRSSRAVELSSHRPEHDHVFVNPHSVHMVAVQDKLTWAPLTLLSFNS